MTLRPLVVVAIVLGLASCAQMNPRNTHSPRATAVDVIEDKYIVVDQEPIVVHGADIVEMTIARSSSRPATRSALLGECAPPST